jgi:hypothetical protein
VTRFAGTISPKAPGVAAAKAHLTTRQLSPAGPDLQLFFEGVADQTQYLTKVGGMVTRASLQVGVRQLAPID